MDKKLIYKIPALPREPPPPQIKTVNTRYEVRAVFFLFCFVINLSKIGGGK